MKTHLELEIKHLRHKVKFIDMSQLRGVEIKGAGYTAVEDENTTLVFIQDIEETLKDISLMPWIAHELVHVLQIITEKISAKFENEQEHMAYLMHYMMSELIDSTKNICKCNDGQECDVCCIGCGCYKEKCEC